MTINMETTGNPIADTALKSFGEAWHYRAAGFITPDGRFIDLSQGTGERVQDHRELFDVVEAHPEIGDSSRVRTLWKFLEASECIRFHSNAREIIASWVADPTRAQLRLLASLRNDAQVELHLSFWEDVDMHHNESFHSDVSWEDLQALAKEWRVAANENNMTMNEEEYQYA